MISLVIWLLIGGELTDGDALRQSVFPNCRITTEEAFDHLIAARLVATPEVSEWMALAVAEHESCLERFAPTFAPQNGGHWFCGVMQTGGTKTLAECASQVSTLLAGYRLGVDELSKDVRSSRDNMMLALWKYSGGAGFALRCATGDVSKACGYAWFFVRRARSFQKLLAHPKPLEL